MNVKNRVVDEEVIEVHNIVAICLQNGKSMTGYGERLLCVTETFVYIQVERLQDVLDDFAVKDELTANAFKSKIFIIAPIMKLQRQLIRLCKRGVSN